MFFFLKIKRAKAKKKGNNIRQKCFFFLLIVTIIVKFNEKTKKKKKRCFLLCQTIQKNRPWMQFFTLHNVKQQNCEANVTKNVSALAKGVDITHVP